MKSQIPDPRSQIIILFTICCLLLTTLLGCEAFVRKFTRKPKKVTLPQEEMVLEPEEYKGSGMPKEELYRQYLLYWKSWHDELINSLSSGGSNKKQISCVSEAIKNLEQLRLLLNETKQEGLDIYLNQLKDLKESIVQDVYGNNVNKNRLSAEQIKRNILRDFSYHKIKDCLV